MWSSGLASNVLQPAADVGVTISPDRLYKDGRVDVDLLRSQEAQLSTLADEGDAAQRRSRRDPRSAYVSTIGDARTQLQGQIADLTSILENTALAARLVPSMMGADGPRTYFMGFQTNAEARGTGGLLGGFGILRFDNGAPTVDTLASNTDLADAIAPIDLGLEYDQQYGFANPFTDFRNSNMSPHFPVCCSDLEDHVGRADGHECRRSNRHRPRRVELHPWRRRADHHAGW